MNDGHRVDGCGGRWVDIGTMRDPYLQLCVRCRGRRQRPADEGDEVDVELLAARENRLKDDLEELQRSENPQDDVRGYRILMTILFCCALSLAATLYLIFSNGSPAP